VATALSLAKEVEDLTVGANRVCFDGRSRENKCGCGIPTTAGRVCI